MDKFGMAKQLSTISACDSVTWIAERLKSGSYTVSDLSRWLQGFDVGDFSDDIEPIVVISEAICCLADSEKGIAEDSLANVLAEFLQLRVDKWLNSETQILSAMREAGVLLPETALVNALWLASRLKNPTVLAEPVYALFERQRTGKSPLLRELFRSALISALIDNQIDDRLLEFWNDLAAEGVSRDGKFRCCTADIVAGIFNLLDAMMPTLEQSEWRRCDSRRLLEAFESEALASEQWSVDFVHQARRRDWPKWIVESFPGSLSLTISKNTHYIWSEVSEAIRSIRSDAPAQGFANGIDVIDLQKLTSVEELREFTVIVDVLDKKRRAFSDVSNAVFEDDIRDGLKDLASDNRLSETTRKHFETLHENAVCRFHASVV